MNNKIVMLPTEMSNIVLDNNKLRLTPYAGHGFDPQHLYELSNDKINDGDWKYNPLLKHVWKHNRKGKDNNVIHPETRKIISTTDPLLIEEGIPQMNIPTVQEFINSYTL